MNMTFHESYGDLPANVLSLYRRNNVSPSDHDDLVDMATDQRERIDWTYVRFLVKQFSPNNCYRNFTARQYHTARYAGGFDA